MSANICVTPTTLAATELGVPAVILTTGPAAVRYNSKSTRLDKSPRFLDMPLNSKIQYPFIYAIHEMNKCAFTNADEVVAINEFDASITYETFNRDPVVSYIPVDLSNYEVNNWSPKNVTLVNPRTKNKGLDIFLDISRQLPNVNFQIVGDLYENSKKRAIRKLTNVEYLGYEKDMKKVYENTKLLLVPSKYQEGGPRIIPEAAVNGIPAIGSDLGGIPDYIDKGGEVVSDYNNTTAWVSVIKKYLQDEDYYTKKSQQAREAAMRFKKEDIIDEHEERLQRLIE
ncbi:glycosyltransferase [Halopiger thermotolerans]